MDYLDYWKLNDKPFEGTRNTKFFYASENHAEALERLLYILRDRNMNFGLLTGEIGSGKTITKTILEHMLLKENYEVVSIENACFPFHPLLIEILSQLKNSKIDLKETDEYTAMIILKELLVNIVIENNRHLVILLDEAHQLEKACLDKVKNLTNICSEEENYITIILVGQPELKPLIRSLPQLDQRVSLRYHLRYLPLNEVEGYIMHRLKVASCPYKSVFTERAIELIYEGTRGIPREINRVCRLAMDNAFSLALHNISESVIKDILRDYNLQSSTSEDLGRIDTMNDIFPRKSQNIFLQKIIVLDDSASKDNPIFPMLKNMAHSVVQSDKKVKSLANTAESADIIIIKIDLKKNFDVSLFKEIIKIKDTIKTPVLFILDPYSSQMFKIKMKNIAISGAYKWLLFMPFNEKEIRNKIESMIDAKRTL